VEHLRCPDLKMRLHNTLHIVDGYGDAETREASSKLASSLGSLLRIKFGKSQYSSGSRNCSAVRFVKRPLKIVYVNLSFKPLIYVERV